MDFYSPLRYPGGKGKVADYFKQIFRENELYDGIYVEPYAGGASVALSLLFNEYASKIIINDVDISIYAFWHSVLNKPDELCKLINDTKVNVTNWEVQKDVQRRRNSFGLLKLGFSTFFLNRTNRSGILKAGIIGGKDQSGPWKIDARYNKTDLIKRIQRIARYKDNIELFNMDAVELVKTLRNELPSNTLFYLDPPYYVKGKDLYLNYYKDEDHRLIASEVSKITEQKFILTYDKVPFISELYKEYRQVDYTLNYSAASASKGEELIIFSDNLDIAESPMLDVELY